MYETLLKLVDRLVISYLSYRKGKSDAILQAYQEIDVQLRKKREIQEKLKANDYQDYMDEKFKL